MVSEKEKQPTRTDILRRNARKDYWSCPCYDGVAIRGMRATFAARHCFLFSNLTSLEACPTYVIGITECLSVESARNSNSNSVYILAKGTFGAFVVLIYVYLKDTSVTWSDVAVMKPKPKQREQKWRCGRIRKTQKWRTMPQAYDGRHMRVSKPPGRSPSEIARMESGQRHGWSASLVLLYLCADRYILLFLLIVSLWTEHTTGVANLAVFRLKLATFFLI